MPDQPHVKLAPNPSTAQPPAAGRGDGGGDYAAVALLVRAAATGDQRAWQALVERFTPALRAVARGFRLAPADVDDVVQNTWLAALRHIHNLQKPEAIGAWLCVTARREALRSLQRQLREIPTDDPSPLAAPACDQPDTILLETERQQELEAAVRRLPTRQSRLLHTLLVTPATSYADISSRLDMPIGSIGPTRDRGLARLRRDRTLTDVLRDDHAA
jgi:RNA polymerase sigma factor (sigma-70 family)